jgi:hypothetical protein
MKTLAAAIVAVLAVAAPACAGESLFSRVYTVETVPAGHYELEQSVRRREGRSFGSYAAEDFASEVEYGFTDSFQGAFYLRYGRIDATGAPDDSDPDGATGFTRHMTYFQGGSAEFIYRVLNPVKDPIGLAFYYEPALEIHDQHDGLSYRNFENEYRVLLQKNFLDDQLILVYNPVFEFEFFNYLGSANDAAGTGPNWNPELDFNNELGVSYRFAPDWYGGWEFRNHNEINGFRGHDHSVYWTGPALHYANQKSWVTVGVLRQFYGVPSGTDDSGSYIGPKGQFLHSHEKWETTIKVGFPF